MIDLEQWRAGIERELDEINLRCDREDVPRSNSLAKLLEYGVPLPNCSCGAEAQFDRFDAAWLWIECSKYCGRETNGFMTTDEAATAWKVLK